MQDDNQDNVTSKVVVLFIIACAILIAALLSGCNPAKQMDKNPEVAAKYCADKFPVREILVHDTLWNDSIRAILVDTIELFKGKYSPIKPNGVYIQDTIQDDSKYIKLEPNCDECIRTIHMLQDRLAVIRRNYQPSVTITKTVVDSAAVVHLRNELRKANDAATEYLKLYQSKDVELLQARGKLRGARVMNASMLVLLLAAGWIAFKRKKQRI